MTHTVMLVDDEPNVLYGLHRALYRQPYQIMTARTAEEAMLVLKMRAVDLIVCDEKMPGMHGTEFLAWVAEHFPDVVRLVLTGQPSVASAVRAINDARVFQYLTKPCDEVKLALAIREGLEMHDAQKQAQATAV